MKKKEASLFCLLEVKKKSKHLSWIERKMYKRLLPYYTHYTDEVYKARDRKAVTDDGTVFKIKRRKNFRKVLPQQESGSDKNRRKRAY